MNAKFDHLTGKRDDGGSNGDVIQLKKLTTKKYVSTKINDPKQDDDIKYTYKTVATFQREKIQNDILSSPEQ